MAELVNEVRIEERLKIKIGEAKNLPIRSHGSVSERDVYCILSLDQEEIFRTSTIDRTLNPFFGEEFQFNVPRRFRFLSVYIYDRDKTEKVIGKVAVKREDLQIYHNKDHWFQIKPVNQHTEVQGKVHLDINFERPTDENGVEKLIVKVSECNDLTLCHGCCDPFATIAVRLTSGRVETRRTRVRKKTNSPQFDEKFTFELRSWRKNSDSRYNVADVGDWCELVITLYHDGGSSQFFLGEVRVPLGQNIQQSAWYLLQPGKRTYIKSKPESLCSDMGSLRLKIHYTRDYVFDKHIYGKLRELLLKSCSVQPVTSSACYLLGEIIPNKFDAAQPLARIFLHHGMIVPVMKALAVWEISKITDANTIFRGNTLVSKMMDETMRLAGLGYLHETLKKPLETVLTERKSCEIDPSRVSDSSTIHTNLNNLKEYVEIIFQAIINSALKCPPVLCELFHELRQIASSRFPDNKEVRYSVISGFIFLRFFAPAILGPRLFDLTNKHIDTQINRTLTLISKTIQSLCNLVTSRTTACKEQYMCSMYQTFYTDMHITAIRQFLEIISASSSLSHDKNNSRVILKEGVMTKRAQGRKRFGRKNFKQRYFTLTTQDLSYSKQKGKEPLCTIPLSDILAVERLQHDSFRKSNMFQIVQPTRVLYIQASNCVEEKEWVDLLGKMCYTNHQRLQTYHPAAFVNGLWQCCFSPAESAEGCCNVSSETQLQMNIDSDRELARIHSLIVEHMDRVQSIINFCESRSVLGSRVNDSDFVGTCIIEDPASCCKTLFDLRDAAVDLQTQTRIYLRKIARETKYGSKQAPIGDDNYLLLANRIDTSIKTS
ncbi:ras GTPase-activating protein 3 [Halyomorpha halys]|uniref:ras GTPase-activating protein 3 n=1 Tax=Halyomorpha halys TaxID=286706 RepID=UPI0006D4F6B1|nr:GTPase-activating protein isoform X1 [Halyomorpha halys]